jgi:VWFA-related protein
LRRLGTRLLASIVTPAVTAALSASLVLAPAASFAQQGGDDKGTATLQVYTRLTVVDVTATDSAGQAVHGLQQSDFTVFEDGKPQPIRNFEEIETRPAQYPRQMPPNVYSNLQPPPPSPAVNILLLDLANMAAADSTNARALSRSLDTQHRVKLAAMQALAQMPAGTRVAVLAMTNNLRIVQSFTPDRDLLIAAINAVQYDMEGNEGGAPMPGTRARNPSPFGDQDNGAGQGVQANNRNQMVLEAFDRIATDTAAMKVRKNLIWFTKGIPEITDPNERPANLPDYTKALTHAYDLLTAAQVSVYPVDVLGVDRLGARQLSEQAVAEATGGVAFSETNDMSTAVLKAIDNGANYYSIAYVPPSVKYDGNYHKIEIKLNRKGIDLVYRKGYYADDVAKITMPKGLTLSSEPPPAPKGNMKAPMSRGMATDTGLLFEVGVQPSTVPPKPGDPPIFGTLDEKLKGKRLTRYAFQYVVPGEQIKFNDGPKGTHVGSLEYDIAVYDANDKLLTGLSQTVKMPLSDSTYQQIVKNHTPIRFLQQIDLPQGQLFLRVGVLDTTTDKVGTLEMALSVGRKAPAAPGPTPGE